MVILANISICEYDFPKQNSVKNEQTGSKMKLRTLDALMRVNLCGNFVKLWIGQTSFINI